jgi:phosphatidylinositol-3-phosphatase
MSAAAGGEGQTSPPPPPHSSSAGAPERRGPSHLAQSEPSPAPRYDIPALERRREELAAQVAELHWDLGGLAYEMAIRSHFRNDILMRRAALLQERDAELAEVERKLGYERALQGGPTGERSRRAWAGVLPPARVSVLLLVAFMGFGVAMGAVAKGAGSTRTRPREVLVARMPAAAAASVKPARIAPPAAEPTTEPEATPSSSGEGQSAAGGSGAASAGGAGKSSAGKSGSSGSSGSSGTGSANHPSAGAGSPGSGAGSAGGGSATKLPPVRHVFVVMLDDEPYASVFGPASQARYVTGTLEHEGELLVRYYAVAHQQLANAVALISGQGPTVQTAQNCPTYENVAPGTIGAEGQVSGQGCVYSSDTPTLIGQLTVRQLTWRAYLEGMGEGGQGADGACGHPALGSSDPSASATPPAGQAYATWRNPFVYFQAITGSPECASDDVGMSRLASDLASPASTPNFAYIVPGLCDDGNPSPCAPGAPAGMAPADGFLQKVIPEIMASKAYKESGLLVITTDQAPSSGEYADSSSCCGQPSFPNLPAANDALGKPGGGQVGALLLSPFIKGGNLAQDTYNHFSLLRTIEDLFGLKHLGYAGGKEVSSFSPSLFTASKSG